VPDFENDPTITHLLKSVGLDLRRQELLATLSEADVQRVTRFGEKRSYRDGQLMFEGNEEVSLRVFHATCRRARRGECEHHCSRESNHLRPPPP
jgi:hypothetical protein